MEEKEVCVAFHAKEIESRDPISKGTIKEHYCALSAPGLFTRPECDGDYNNCDLDLTPEEWGKRICELISEGEL